MNAGLRTGSASDSHVGERRMTGLTERAGGGPVSPAGTCPEGVAEVMSPAPRCAAGAAVTEVSTRSWCWFRTQKEACGTDKQGTVSSPREGMAGSQGWELGGHREHSRSRAACALAALVSTRAVLAKGSSIFLPSTCSMAVGPSCLATPTWALTAPAETFANAQLQ